MAQRLEEVEEKGGKDNRRSKHPTLPFSSFMLRSTGATVALRRRQQRTTLLVAKRFASGLSDKDLDLENYPVLPDVSRQHAPAKGWDDMLARRNFGDPVRLSCICMETNNLCSSGPPSGGAVFDVGSRHFFNASRQRSTTAVCRFAELCGSCSSPQVSG